MKFKNIGSSIIDIPLGIVWNILDYIFSGLKSVLSKAVPVLFLFIPRFCDIQYTYDVHMMSILNADEHLMYILISDEHLM